MVNFRVLLSAISAIGMVSSFAMPVSAADEPLTEIRRNNPDTIHAPFGVYTHAVSIPAGAEMVYISGQTGLDKEGNTVSGGIREQTKQAISNLKAILESEGLTAKDIVNMTVYLTDLESLPASSEERRAFLDSEHFPAATLVIVASLAAPDLLIEIEAVAARIPKTAQ